MKRMVVRAAAAGGVLVLIVAGVLWNISRRGSSAIEQWIGQELQTVAGAYLTPRLTFADLDYEYPMTVRLKHMKLVADDPANAGKTIDILGVEEATVQLAEVPVIGQPIHIENVILRRPLFQAVSAGAGSNHLVGYSQFVKGSLAAATQQFDPALINLPRLSEVLRIRRVQLIDGRIVYDSRTGAPPMQLDRINTTLDAGGSRRRSVC